MDASSGAAVRGVAEGAPLPARWRDRLETGAALAATAMMCGLAAFPWMAAATRLAPEQSAVTHATAGAEPARVTGREVLVAGYISQPFYHRSDVRLTRPDGTDLTLRGMGWDGDALHPPIDGGIRSVQWWGRTGLMVDFLHNKAVARLGRGAHGRRLANPVVETVAAEGTLAGQPTPTRILLTELFERFEFTHGHNVLLATPLLRLPSLWPSVTPYVGIGAGFALPHVEVWSAGDPRERRTNEYQLAGGAAQLVAGLDLRVGRLVLVRRVQAVVGVDLGGADGRAFLAQLRHARRSLAPGAPLVDGCRAAPRPLLDDAHRPPDRGWRRVGGRAPHGEGGVPWP